MPEELEIVDNIDIEPIEEEEEPKGVPPPDRPVEEPKYKNKYLQWRNNVTSGTYNVTQILGNPEIILNDGVNQIRLSDILGYQLPNDNLTKFIEDNELSEAEFGFMDEDLMLKVGDGWKSIFDILDLEPLSKVGRYKRNLLQVNKKYNDKTKLI